MVGAGGRGVLEAPFETFNVSKGAFRTSVWLVVEGLGILLGPRPESRSDPAADERPQPVVGERRGRGVLQEREKEPHQDLGESREVVVGGDVTSTVKKSASPTCRSRPR
ncbi:hypothetical protein [Amycolatopsis sp. NPDC051071]|uniref:hypothetical protein n=1 Tax=Amycolatopsis sp. NPDC051071 TaxID=3154637 RepID=UPI003427C3C5